MVVAPSRSEPTVLLDATAIPADRGGVGRYVDQLAQALDALGANLSVACQPSDAEIFSALAPSSRIVPVDDRLRNRAARLLWEQSGLPVLARRVGAQVIHSPHYTMPLATRLPVVVTLHDATFFSDPALHLGVKGRFFRSWTRVSLRRAAVAIVPSAATADELVRHAGARRDGLTVAHHGVDPIVFHPPTVDQVQALRAKLELVDGDFIAFLGTIEPRKNVPALVRAFVMATSDRDRPPALVLAGAPGWDENVDSALAAVPADLRVIRTGHLPVEELPALLGGATVVAYPSLGEGFGLPVLEAMACGAAVLTTKELALPEVGGDAVAYSGTGADDIAAVLGELLDDPARRADLGRRAQERAETFTWARAAALHQDAYRAAVRSR